MLSHIPAKSCISVNDISSHQGCYQHGFYHTSCNNDIPILNVISGILNYVEGKEKTFSNLHVPARNCISEPKGQDVSIMLRLNQEKGGGLDLRPE